MVSGARHLLSFGAVAVLVDGFRQVHKASPQLLVRSFHDWQAVVGYNSAARVAYVLGGKLHPLSDRAHFEQRREHELARARRPNPMFNA